MTDARALASDVMEQVRNLLRESGMTKTELAEVLGVTPGYVSHLLVGRKRNLTIETLVKLATALGAQVEITFTIERAKPSIGGGITYTFPPVEPTLSTMSTTSKAVITGDDEE